MAFSRRLLDQGERVVLSTRTHVKALLLPALWLILLAAVAGYLSTFAVGAGRAAPLVLAVVWLVALLVALPLVVRPFLSWLSTAYLLTDRRLITRTGILRRRGHDIPVSRVTDVAYEHGLVDRVLGCGTLVVSLATEQGGVLLHDLPRVEQVYVAFSDLLLDGADDRSFGDGDQHHARTSRPGRRLDDGT